MLIFAGFSQKLDQYTLIEQSNNMPLKQLLYVTLIEQSDRNTQDFDNNA